jgi:hypothetical protein
MKIIRVESIEIPHWSFISYAKEAPLDVCWWSPILATIIKHTYRVSLKKGEVFLQDFLIFVHWKYTFIHIYLIQPPNIRQFSIIQDFTASWQIKNEHMAGNLKIIHHKDQHFMFLKIFLHFTKLYCSWQFIDLRKNSLMELLKVG